jgi:hypothetical protein
LLASHTLTLNFFASLVSFPEWQRLLFLLEKIQIYLVSIIVVSTENIFLMHINILNICLCFTIHDIVVDLIAHCLLFVSTLPIVIMWKCVFVFTKVRASSETYFSLFLLVMASTNLRHVHRNLRFSSRTHMYGLTWKRLWIKVLCF